MRVSRQKRFKEELRQLRKNFKRIAKSGSFGKIEEDDAELIAEKFDYDQMKVSYQP